MIPEITSCVNYSQFIDLQDIKQNLTEFDGVAAYCRVSTTRQNLVGQVDALVSSVCWFADWLDGVICDRSRVRVFSEAHTGTTLDRPELRRCIEAAKRDRLLVCCQDINRLVRHPDYCPYRGRTPRPRRSDIAELLSLGVTFALDVPFTATEAEIRSAETLRSMRHGNRGGRPRVSPEDEQRVRSWQLLGLSYGDIGKLTGIPKSTVRDILKNRAERV